MISVVLFSVNLHPLHFWNIKKHDGLVVVDTNDLLCRLISFFFPAAFQEHFTGGDSVYLFSILSTLSNLLTVILLFSTFSSNLSLLPSTSQTVMSYSLRPVRASSHRPYSYQYSTSSCVVFFVVVFLGFFDSKCFSSI